MKLNNFIIYNCAEKLANSFINTDLYLPIKANFFLQKNIQTFVALAKEIENSRINIIQHYGESNEAGELIIPSSQEEQAIKELEELFAIEQEVNIHMLKLDDFGNTELTLEQMNAIMFMIEE